jgi:hypothetical protein
VPERFCQRHWDGYRKVMETGVTRYGVSMVPGPDGRPCGIAAVIPDETRRSEPMGLRRGFSAG